MSEPSLILFRGDVERLLNLKTRAAQRFMRRLPTIKIGNRLAVRRETLIRELARMERGRDG